MKKSRTLLVMLGIAAVLALLLALISVIGAEKEPGVGVDTEPEVTYLYLVERDPKEIRAIDYIYEGAEPIRLILTSKWTLLEDDSLPVNQTTASTLANAMATVAVQRTVVEKAEDYAQYGLESPKTQITLTYTDGDTITFFVGNENKRAENTHYLKTSESDAVYLVSSNMLTFIAHDRVSLLELDSVPDIETADLKSVVIEKANGGGIRLSRIQSEESATLWKAVYGDGSEAQLDSSNLAGDLLAAVLSLPFTEPVWCREVTDEKKAEFGLSDAEAIRVTLNYTETVTGSGGEASSDATVKVDRSFTILLGKQLEQGEEDEKIRYAYVMAEESAYVYRAIINDASMLFEDFAPAA